MPCIINLHKLMQQIGILLPLVAAMWLFGALSSPEEVQIHSVQSTHPRNYVYSVHFCPQTGV